MKVPPVTEIGVSWRVLEGGGVEDGEKRKKIYFQFKEKEKGEGGKGIRKEKKGEPPSAELRTNSSVNTIWTMIQKR